MAAFVFVAGLIGFVAYKLRGPEKAPVVKTIENKVIVHDKSPGGASPEELKRLADLKAQQQKAQEDLDARQRQIEAQAAKQKADADALRDQADKDRQERMRAEKAAADADAKLKQQQLDADNQRLADQQRQAAALADANRAAEAERAQRAAAQKALDDNLRAQKEAAAKRIPDYTGPNTGSITWTGTVRKGMEVTIDGSSASSGTVSGSLPGVLVQVGFPKELDKRIALFVQPNKQNNYKLLGFRVANGPDGPLQITFTWNRP